MYINAGSILASSRGTFIRFPCAAAHPSFRAESIYFCASGGWKKLTYKLCHSHSLEHTTTNARSEIAIWGLCFLWVRRAFDITTGWSFLVCACVERVTRSPPVECLLYLSAYFASSVARSATEIERRIPQLGTPDARARVCARDQLISHPRVGVRLCVWVIIQIYNWISGVNCAILHILTLRERHGEVIYINAGPSVNNWGGVRVSHPWTAAQFVSEFEATRSNK